MFICHIYYVWDKIERHLRAMHAANDVLNVNKCVWMLFLGTFFKTFIANIFPDAAPATFRTWKTYKKKKAITSSTQWARPNNDMELKNVIKVILWKYIWIRGGYLSIASLSQHPQQFKTLRPDVLCSLIDVVLRYLNLLTVVQIAEERSHAIICSLSINWL